MPKIIAGREGVHGTVNRSTHNGIIVEGLATTGARQRWTRMSILNTTYSGKFSSDRAVAEYSGRIWRIRPVRIALE
ncbi:MAG TPA: glycogen/starch/alpha-glucan phosphorylase [Paraburkholderia sp.]|nr:glycogen/starch/alpha-glucan phosphorylase [Paraburkholderia sp.]